MDPKPYDVPPDQPVGGAPPASSFEPSHLPGTPPRQRPEKVKKKGGSAAQRKPKGNPRKNPKKKKT